jgi:thiol peroxidase
MSCGRAWPAHKRQSAWEARGRDRRIGMRRIPEREDRMSEERVGEAFELEERLTVIGRKLEPGQPAPDFLLDRFDAQEGGVREERLGDSAGLVRVLQVVNSVDTPVCHRETRHWDELRGSLPATVRLYTISMDLPYAQARWQQAEGVSHTLLSAHRSEQFGRDYGVLLKEWRLLQRAVFVIDRADRVVYAEYVADQMQEPDYEAALQAARQAAGS